MVEYDIFFKSIPWLVNKVHMNVRIVRIHLSSALVNRQEHRFDTRSSLRHQAGCSGRSDSQTSDVTASVLLHIFVQCRISFRQTLDERIVLFAFAVVHLESATLFRHFY